MDDLDLSLWRLAELVVVALVVAGGLRGLRLILQLAPMPAARRRSLEQALPVVDLLVWAVYAVLAVQFALPGPLAGVAVLGLLFGGVWLGRHALGDLVTGVFLRASGSVGRGDWVRIERPGEAREGPSGVEGEVTQVTGRGLVLETRDSEQVLVPYSQVVRRSLLRTPRTDGRVRHSFRIPAGASNAPGSDRLRQLAMLCHWSSVARPPVVSVNDDGEHEVTVFALEPGRGPEIEAFVRKALRS